eukprot:gene17570-27050_t
MALREARDAAGKAKRQKQHAIAATLAGGMCGGVEATISYPAEFAKTRLQLLDASAYAGSTAADKAKRSMRRVLATTIQEEGYRGVYRGVSVVIISGIPKNALRFGVHDAVAPSYGSAVGGFIAGLSASFGVIIPQETIKTTLIHNARTPTPMTPSQCVAHIFGKYGLRGFYRGAVPTAMKNSVNTGVRFPLQEFFRSYLPSPRASPGLDSLYHGTAGVIAGYGSVLVTQPFDTVKTKLQGISSSSAVVERTSLFTAVSNTLRAGGVRALPRLLKATPENAVLFALYPRVQQAVDASLFGA